MSFIFDTGSTWTWIPNKDCPESQCPNDHYYYDRSTNYYDTRDQDQVTYGIGQVKGYVVVDDVAVADSVDLQANDVNFLSVYYAKDMSTLKSDGLLGLSPRSSRKVSANSGHEMHLLVDELYKDGKIDRPWFAIYLTFVGQQSKIQFGGYDNYYVQKAQEEDTEGILASKKSGDGIFWMDINSQQHWQVSIFEAKIGNKTLSIKAKNAIFDTGTSLLYFPT